MKLLGPGEYDMKVIPAIKPEDRFREYRNRMGPAYKERNAARMRKSRAQRLPEFICIDGEGEGKGKAHRYVLISAYDKHGNGDYRENANGLSWEEVFEFLYKQFEANPRAAYTGFYLGYDFNHFLSAKAGFPEKAAQSLFTKPGKAARLIKDGTIRRSKYRPVKVGRWEIDALGLKRIQIRPRPDGCYCYEQAQKCTHEQLSWMYICDAGPFYQMPFIKVIDKGGWKDDPDGWPVTQEEYDIILRGKNDRSGAHLGPEMRYYNRLENIVLARVMERLAKGFQSFGIVLAKDQWYGPGAVAQRWLGKHGAPKRAELRRTGKHGSPLMPKSFWIHCRYSYFGGWFEIFSHGLILGKTWNYDIHNAYPFATTKLPHICRECSYKEGTGPYDGTGKYVLLYGTVFGKDTRIGPMPHRDKSGSILRPTVTKGWYWRFEIEAARRAGLVKRVVVEQWSEFIPCSHPNPFTEVEDLYYKRLEVGSHGAQGMAIKNNNNSIYGKFAQSIGGAPYNNWFYASYITAHCRTQILDAIATHPGGSQSVLMVATDGICFDSAHPGLALSDSLGDWEEDTYTDLCLFKPGVYWHREGKEALARVKSRGVPKEEFQKAIEQVEPKFRYFIEAKRHPQWEWNTHFSAAAWDQEEYDLWVAERSWPHFIVNINFRMKTCLQALNEGNWHSSAQVLESFPLGQDSNPHIKRHLRGTDFNREKNRIDTTIHTLPIEERQTYYHNEVDRPKPMSLGFGLDGETAFGPLIEAAGILRGSPANYDLPIEENPDIEWVRVWG